MNKEHAFLAGQRLVLAGTYKAHDSACRIFCLLTERLGLERHFQFVFYHILAIGFKEGTSR